jgi:hypothetical protein
VGLTRRRAAASTAQDVEVRPAIGLQHMLGVEPHPSAIATGRRGSPIGSPVVKLILVNHELQGPSRLIEPDQVAGVHEAERTAHLRNGRCVFMSASPARVRSRAGGFVSVIGRPPGWLWSLGQRPNR